MSCRELPNISTNYPSASSRHCPSAQEAVTTTLLSGRERRSLGSHIMPDKSHKSGSLTKARSRALFLLRLEKPFETTQKLKELAALSHTPPLREGAFCLLSGRERLQVEESLRAQDLQLDPFFIPVRSSAWKDFDEHSRYPTLGQDSTLPQFRATAPDTIFSPSQSDYPIWYFVYGTLSQSSLRARIIRVAESEIMPAQTASVVGGQLEMWGGRYKALIDGDERIVGHAFTVFTEQQEDALRAYESENYEVVRCQIQLETHAVDGCTFRFVGDVD